MLVLLDLFLGAVRRGDFLSDLHNNYSFRGHSCVLACKIWGGRRFLGFILGCCNGHRHYHGFGLRKCWTLVSRYLTYLVTLAGNMPLNHLDSPICFFETYFGGWIWHNLTARFFCGHHIHWQKRCFIKINFPMRFFGKNCWHPFSRQSESRTSKSFLMVLC